MAGLKGRSGPPGNQNAFRHGLAGLADRRTVGALSPADQAIREEILAGLLQDKGGDGQVSTALHVLAEVIASDAAWLAAFNKATEDVLEKNQKARSNPKALATLDGYKRGLVNSLTGNLARFGFDRVVKVETLQEVIESMTETAGTSENTSPAGPGATATEAESPGEAGGVSANTR